jgi:hypothetical protein
MIISKQIGSVAWNKLFLSRALAVDINRQNDNKEKLSVLSHIGQIIATKCSMFLILKNLFRSLSSQFDAHNSTLDAPYHLLD